MKENVLIDKSIAFASRIVKLHQYLIRTKKETVISKQIVRSGLPLEQISTKQIMVKARRTLLQKCILL